MMILDRFEEDKAIVEIDGKVIIIDRIKVDSGVKEGDVLFYEEGIYYRDKEGTEIRKKELMEKFMDMWED